MILSYNWLKQFVTIDVPPQELAKALVSAGLEVDSIQQRTIPQGIVVGHVLQCAKHPNADKLSVCLVDIAQAEPLHIVCGAANVRAGLKVACATIGTQFSADFIIKKTKLRGELSEGMLCSEQELGLSDASSGIIELDQECQIGQPLSIWYPDDTLFELEITPDRGDCLSILGVAREIACAFSAPLGFNSATPVESGSPLQDAISVYLDEPARCPRYMGRLIRDITIAPSPLWLRNRLASAGIRSINNVVDITNYILIQYGQPMHAFDYDAIGGKTIRVAAAREGQRFTTLDGVERTLTSADLLICDANAGVALAGVMGGAGSEISATTTNVFLECAYFDPAGIRVTSKRLGLSTDSSYRFERGVDALQGLERALDTAAEMIRQLAGGTIAQGRIDQYPEPIKNKSIPLRPARANRLLGIELSAQTMVDYLQGLGMPCLERSAGQLLFEVPHFRHDITLEVDLIEEIGRLFGYDNIPLKQRGEVSLIQGVSPRESKSDQIRQALAFAGLNEIVTNSMCSDKIRALLTPAVEPVKLLNPLNPEMEQMRTTLLGNHLQAVAYNQNRRNHHCAFFELGRVFEHEQGNPLAGERHLVGITLEGSFFAKDWSNQPLTADFYLLKGLIAAFAEHAGLGALSFSAPQADRYPYFDEHSATIQGRGGVHGAVGRVKGSHSKAFGIDSAVFHCVLDVSAFLASAPTQPSYRPITRYPAVERDFAFVLPDSMPVSAIVDSITGVSELISAVTPFDVYRGERLGEGFKSVAFAVRIESIERTLSESESEALSEAIIQRVKQDHDISLRL